MSTAISCTGPIALKPGRRGQGDNQSADGGDTTDSSIAGTVVIFDWAETLRDTLSRADYSDHAATVDTTSTAAQDEELRYSSSLKAAAGAHEAATAVAAVTDASAAEAAGRGGAGGGGGSDGGASEGWKTDGTTMAEGRHGAEGGEGARRTPPAGERGVEEEVLAEEFVDIFHGEAFTDRKSTFQAHLARVYSERQVGCCSRGVGVTLL